MRYFLELAYDGSDFHGWQRQNNAKSIQETIENALSMLLAEEQKIVGCGRTDTGVHAKQYFAHFDNAKDLGSMDLCYKLNAVLPKSIAISKLHEVSHDAHARYSATKRSYEYCISLAKNPFTEAYSWNLKQIPELALMQEAALNFIGEKDFSAFCKQAAEKDSHRCDVSEISVSQSGHEISIQISANRFLRNMVRAIVGTLVEVGLKKIEPKAIETILLSKDRGEAGVSAPAKGLFLTRIEYPKSLFRHE